MKTEYLKLKIQIELLCGKYLKNVCAMKFHFPHSKTVEIIIEILL